MSDIEIIMSICAIAVTVCVSLLVYNNLRQTKKVAEEIARKVAEKKINENFEDYIKKIKKQIEELKNCIDIEKNNAAEIKKIKDAIYNFYDYAINVENPGEKVNGIEKLKDIHN